MNSVIFAVVFSLLSNTPRLTHPDPNKSCALPRSTTANATTTTKTLDLETTIYLPGVVIAAQTQQCTCLGAKQTTHNVSCARPDGTKFNKVGLCWTKHVLGSSQECGTVCQPDLLVCSGNPPPSCQ